VELHDPAYAERFLFDGLLGLHAISLPDSPRVPLYGSISKFSPVSVVSSPLSSALLYEYGSVTLHRSKYRYGIAALEAAVDARKVRDPDNLANMAFSGDVVSIALSIYDWRRALTWLYDRRDEAHPKKRYAERICPSLRYPPPDLRGCRVLRRGIGSVESV
jgi:hypothetical protein